MKTYKIHKKLSLVLAILSIVAKAQITVLSPQNKAVYQRNASNTANIPVSGTFNFGAISVLQFRLVDPTTNTPLPGFDWSLLQAMPIGGLVQGTINNVPAGWHKLELRAMRSNATVMVGNVPFFGVGDVFVVSGQSNAQGYTDNQYIGATSPKVVTHNNAQYCNPNDLPFPVFSELTGLVAPSPNGTDAWCYGKLGDNLVAQTGFPIAFFNAGSSGASINNFKQSSDNIVTTQPFTGQNYCNSAAENYDNPSFIFNNSSTYATLNPYQFFKKTLNYYSSMYGTRAVLWHHGETDNFLNTPTATYQSDLQHVINKTRTDYNASLPWVVSRASYNDLNSDANIIAAQNNVINPSNQVFAGPATDNINNTNNPGSRDTPDLHFFGFLGLNLLATEWTNFLNPSFFSNSTPVSANTTPVIVPTINSNGTVTMTLPNSYNGYKWIRTDLTGNSNFNNPSEGLGFNLTKSVGTYRCWVQNNGNLQISAAVNVTQMLELVNNGGNCSGDTYVSNLNYYNATNGLGSIEYNATVGGPFNGDGNPIALKGTTYASGLGVSPLSEISFKVPANQYMRFKSKIGIGDEVVGCTNTGGVIFKVYGNGTLIYTSPTLYRNSPVEDIDLPIFNYTDLKLRVEEVSANTTCNKAVWADTRLSCIASDVVPPTLSGMIGVTDSLTKCTSITWPAASDDNGVKKYFIFKNSVKIDSVLAPQLTYTFTGLVPNTAYTFGVQAADFNKNVSSIISKTITTKTVNVDYGNLGDFICSNRTYLPVIAYPVGGTFSFDMSYPGATINASTGAFFSSNNSLYGINYTYTASIAACSDAAGPFVIGTLAPPSSTPVVTTNKTLINSGTDITLSNTAACVGSAFSWDSLGTGLSPLNIIPTQTKTYRGRCSIGECHNYSNLLTVKVLPNCYSSLVLSNPSGNLSPNSNQIKFNSSSTITATNIILNTNNIQYNSANSITLNPGFSVSPGVIFSAKIQNCPN
jgi:hypothetical protein